MLYPPAFCSATPQAESAPVQSVSAEGAESWSSGSGWLVEMIQSALPAVSACALSNRIRWPVASAAAAAAGASCGWAAAPAMPPARSEVTVRAVARPRWRIRLGRSIRHTS